MEGVGVVPVVQPCPITEQAPGTCCNGDASQFSLRVGPNYKKSGNKAPSGPALYDFVGMDVIHDANPMWNVASRYNLPSRFGKAGIPEYLICNFQLPMTPVELMKVKLDGETMNVVFIYALKPEVAQAMENPADAPPQVRLLLEYFRVAPGIPWDKGSTEPGYRGRFKLMALVEGLPSMLKQFNGKPVLLTKSSSVSVGDYHMEVDCNLRCWNVVARKAVKSVWDDVKNMRLHIACTIEAREDDEMPEQVLACHQCCQLPWSLGHEP